MLWLEAPAGVGFSYSRTPSDYNTNDTVTADDNFQALLLFFKGFSEFASNDFYISGESYAGVYIPTLANRIHEGNSNGESNIPLKGILVGNGCTGNSIGTCR
ncbi:SCPL21 [Symbiodinium sp. KB8]|nr:SCPL21 [Symbiodinium sp. KB8]